MKIYTLTLTYNRLPLLQRCVASIRVGKLNGIIVVDNSDTPDTYNWCATQPDITYIKGDNSLGVIARNLGIQYLIDNKKEGVIMQIDDDALLSSNCRDTIEKYFSNPQIGAIGQQAYLWDGWMNYNPNTQVGSSCDFFTGFLWAFRIKKNWLYDVFMAPFWHEEATIQIPIALDGYTLVKCEPLGGHASHRSAPVDWDLHNRNLDHLIKRFKPFIDEEYRRGISFFKLWSVEKYKEKYL